MIYVSPRILRIPCKLGVALLPIHLSLLRSLKLVARLAYICQGRLPFLFTFFKVDKEGTKSCKKSTFFPLIKASCRGEEDLFVTWLLTFSHIPYSSFTSQGRDHNGMSCISCSINFEDYFQSDWTPKKCFRIS